MPPSNEPLVSVVTPAYNEEANIRECVESVRRQTYTNWHMVVVDNASADRTTDIVREYAATDERIKVIRNAALVPVIQNYNVAFRQLSPRAKYCKVIAGDDWIFPTCLEEMVRLMEANPAVGLTSAYSLRGQGVDPPAIPFSSNVVSGRDVCRSYLARGPHLLGAPTSLMFRADVVRESDPFFREPALMADAEACLRVLAKNDYGFVHQVLTFTRVRETLTSSADALNMYVPNILELLIRLGPQCFTPEELQERIDDQLAYYYEFLGTQYFRRRGDQEKFWAYHRGRLAELGHPLQPARLRLSAVLKRAQSAVGALRRRLSVGVREPD